VSRELLIEQVLPDYRGWLRKVAGGMLGPHHEALDDLVQEGAIAMWRAIGTLDPDRSTTDFWLKTSALNRMKTVVQRNHWTGQPKRTNGGHGGSKPEQPLLSLNALSADVEPDYDPEDVSASYALTDAEWAYHEGEIGAALQRLTQRERDYVLRRFWAGWVGPQLDEHFETTSNNIWRKAKPELAAELAHLRS
jgi:RNA polymerase sigma factor (sigma-70 family)